ncbi:hypothetical protein [Rhizobium grahamii]|uniref:Uncharacterized protein n=2 Tax=Rhizobium grahamii TaxID=1120045 RepID=S3IA93_9HYPH|nr:hypothetical protein [Rhizobium grahamii]EPE96183.1 hypothetical protein RGCCGE502_21435 [Rhizobium grahamii CCGE 502]RDJ03049.1 hypothetical protein B5K06_31420 [Rhizobium grahamii]
MATSLIGVNSPSIGQDLEFRVGPGGVGIHDRNQDPGRNWSDRAGGRRCDPDDALDNARDAGFRRAHVVRISPRSVVVEGMTRRGPDRIIFANVRGCPEV